MNNLFSFRLFHLSRRGYQGMLIAALCTIVFALSTFSSAPSAHAASQSPAQGKQCQIVLAGLQPGEQTSRVLSSQCTQGNLPLAVPQASTLLMTWYKDISYGGGSTRIYGDSGPCDSSGYGIPNLAAWGSSWNDFVSSYKVWNNCDWSRAYININYGGACQEEAGNVPWVGSSFNDRISSFWIADDYLSCN